MIGRIVVGVAIAALGIWAVRRLDQRQAAEHARAKWAPAPLPRNPRTDQERLRVSVELLRTVDPDLVADRTVTYGQRRALLMAGTVLAVLLLLLPKYVLMVAFFVITTVYLASLVLRLRLYRLSLIGGGVIKLDDEVARAYPADQLPSYTVLVPAFHEPEVMPRLIANLQALEYPRDRLQILLLLEADDTETVEAAGAIADQDVAFTIVKVPPGEPRTKPKALNYGLTVTTGELVTIYDAEDRPDPLQLLKAAIALHNAPSHVACVQSELGFFNPKQNLLTRWFTLDYRMWFQDLLPGLVQLDAPVPLGGTSNHFRTSALVELGGWDPFNVTEDADLGIRLHRLGYRSGVIDSVTLEEANSDLINWVKQRSRWYKGYTQTLLVHLRHPRQLYRELGFRGTALLCLFVGGTPLLAILNPLFWSFTLIWFVFHPAIVHQIVPTLPYFMGLVSWIIGNILVAYAWLLSARNSNDRLVLAALLSPLYWILMSVAALKAWMQLVTAPTFWEKTQHGLDSDDDDTARGSQNGSEATLERRDLETVGASGDGDHHDAASG